MTIQSILLLPLSSFCFMVEKKKTHLVHCSEIRGGRSTEIFNWYQTQQSLIGVRDFDVAAAKYEAYEEYIYSESAK